MVVVIGGKGAAARESVHCCMKAVLHSAILAAESALLLLLLLTDFQPTDTNTSLPGAWPIQHALISHVLQLLLLCMHQCTHLDELRAWRGGDQGSTQNAAREGADTTINAQHAIAAGCA